MYYGLDIGGTKIELAAYNAQFEKIFDHRIPTPTQCYSEFTQALSQLVLLADQTLGEQAGVGIGIPGFINPATNLVHLANVPCADGKPLQQDLAALLKRSVVIENDANCFTYSEVHGGAAQGAESAFGVILGTGLRRWFLYQ